MVSSQLSSLLSCLRLLCKGRQVADNTLIGRRINRLEPLGPRLKPPRQQLQARHPHDGPAPRPERHRVGVGGLPGPAELALCRVLGVHAAPGGGHDCPRRHDNVSNSLLPSLPLSLSARKSKVSVSRWKPKKMELGFAYSLFSGHTLPVELSF